MYALVQSDLASVISKQLMCDIRKLVGITFLETCVDS